VLKEYLEGGTHGTALSKGKGPYDEVGGEGGLRNQDYAARPLATRRIRTVVLVDSPQAKRKGFQEGVWEGFGDVVQLGFHPQFGKVEVLAMGAWPVAQEDAGVGVCGLSIKLDSQGVDGNCDVWV